MIDIIGDIHGHAGALIKLLKKLGYTKSKGVYTHSFNKTYFLGDLINKGPHSAEVLNIVRKMVDSGQAEMVLGNHELNFILHFYANSVHPETPLMWSKDFGYFQRLYEEFYFDTKVVNEWVNWFKKQPLIIENKNFRIAHACWHQPSIDLIRELSPKTTINSVITNELFLKNSELLESLFLITKGIEVLLPKYVPLTDNKLSQQGKAKIQWWKINEAHRYHDLAANPKKKFPNIEMPIPPSLMNLSYNSDEKPLFMGHYNLNRPISLIATNMAILDYNIKNKKRVVAYRWQGEKELTNDHLISS